METKKRLIDAKFAQHIANIELIPDEAGIVQWVLSHTPTVDAVEVVHGRWIAIGGNHYTRISQCTNCCAKYDFRSNYCPNCGAKMDGDGSG